MHAEVLINNHDRLCKLKDSPNSKTQKHYLKLLPPFENWIIEEIQLEANMDYTICLDDNNQLQYLLTENATKGVAIIQQVTSSINLAQELNIR